MSSGSGLALVLSAALLVSGCGGGGGGDGEQAAETVQGEATQVAGGEKAGRGALEVELNEWDVIPAKDAAQPGKVTFKRGTPAACRMSLK